MTANGIWRYTIVNCSSDLAAENISLTLTERIKIFYGSKAWFSVESFIGERYFYETTRTQTLSFYMCLRAKQLNSY